MLTVRFEPVLPEIVLLCGASAILLIDLFLPEAKRHVSFWLTQIVLSIAAWSALATVQAQPASAFGGMVVDDMLADTLKFLSCVAVSLMLFYSRGYIGLRGLFRGETFVLTLFVLLGVLFYREHMPTERWIGFVLVWLGLAILSWDGLRRARRVAAARLA